MYDPQIYSVADEPMKPFISGFEIRRILDETKGDRHTVRDVISKSLSKCRLSMRETAALLNCTDQDLIEEIKEGARMLKEKIYGQRIVLFAPLYVGNKCINSCEYCGFKAGNKMQQRMTLNDEELISEVEMLEDAGHKRLILVYGEHPDYSPDFIAHSVKTVYGVKKGNGEIRRVNINAAPFDIEGFRKIKEAGIGTFQIFQETYHRDTYAKFHPHGVKSNYDWRLTALDRAQEAGIDDVGIGALFGLADWRFDVLGLVRHVNHLEKVYNVGPHTISFPRLKKASHTKIPSINSVSDEDFTRMVAILRLAVPYTGLILTAREPVRIRQEVLAFGVSQIDGGSKIEMRGYSMNSGKQNINTEQFKLNDERTLGEVMEELISREFIPSFCTACYRTGRTGEHFMEFSVPGFIKRYCTPNAILTFAEYLEDYAIEDTKLLGYKLIDKNIEKMGSDAPKNMLIQRLEKIKEGERDIYF